MRLDLEKSGNDRVVETARHIRGPGTDHALFGIVAEGLHEGDVIGHAHLLQVAEDGKLVRRIRCQMAADVGEIVLEQMKIRALQEPVVVIGIALGAVTLHRYSFAAKPCEAHCIVEWMQDREGKMHAQKRQA